MKKLLIWGRGGHGRVVHEAAAMLNEWSVIETADDTDGNQSWFRFYPRDVWEVHVAIGDNKARETVSERIRTVGYRIATIIHPKAYIAPTATILDGCYVGPMATVMSYAYVRPGCIINTTASIDHDCTLGRYVHIAPGAHLCGTVKVGDRTLIAVGGVVVPNVTIGDDCVLGASSALVETINGNGLKMWGIPARKVE